MSRRKQNERSLSKVVYPAQDVWYRIEAKREGSPCWFIACETRNKHKLRRKYDKLVERGFRIEVKTI